MLETIEFGKKTQGILEDECNNSYVNLIVVHLHWKSTLGLGR
jgi:hypothetical protein